MSEQTAFGKAHQAAKASPFRTAGAAVIVATAAQQGIPNAIEYFQAKDEQTIAYLESQDQAQTAAHEAHIETLDRKLERCEERLMRCAGLEISEEMVTPESAPSLPD